MRRLMLNKLSSMGDLIILISGLSETSSHFWPLTAPVNLWFSKFSGGLKCGPLTRNELTTSLRATVKRHEKLNYSTPCSNI